jgi:protein-tyrosine phosphatase
MIDLHCHVLPEVDDGPDTVQAALDLARAAAAAGTRTMVATPHVSSRYPNRAATIGPAVEALNERLRAAQIDLTVRPGGEIAITHLDELAEDELARLRLAGGEYLLIECPFTPAIDALPPLVGALQSAGHRIVLAHPERCAGFHRRPQMLAELVANDVLTSVTAASLTGRFGREVARFALDLARQGLVHNVASDAHDLAGRRPEISEHLEQAGLGRFTELLTSSYPEAVINGGPLPTHPGPLEADLPARPRAWWRRRSAGE